MNINNLGIKLDVSRNNVLEGRNKIVYEIDKIMLLRIKETIKQEDRIEIIDAMIQTLTTYLESSEGKNK